MGEGRRRVVVEGITPQVDCGSFPAKRALGEEVVVEADVFTDGHDGVNAVLLWRRDGAAAWHEVPMTALVNDRWRGSFRVDELGAWEFTVEGYIDRLGTWERDLAKRLAAGQDVTVDLAIGAALVREAASRAPGGGSGSAAGVAAGGAAGGAAEQAAGGAAGGAAGSAAGVAAGSAAGGAAGGAAEQAAGGAAGAAVGGSAGSAGVAAGGHRAQLAAWADALTDGATPLARRAAVARDPELFALAQRYPDRSRATRHKPLALRVDNPLALASAWYELFPRSAAPEPGQHGTLRDVERQLDRVARMGFDVLYLPPIHPIGRKHRKGPNNAVSAAPRDPGSPWAIGAEEGGHTAIHPELGTLDDFRSLVACAAEKNIAIALDLAFQCAPDHPYVAQHPEWFRKRPDGTIQYAENPPKKYQDIYPFDFECEAWPDLWAELARVVRFWLDEGVRIFRVDNPHTKALQFWEWLIATVQRDHPDVIFLAEAFTRPKLMYRLAKLGFNQSYNYFPWRNGKRELEEYFRELYLSPVADFFRPNLWPNTPDILTEYLQHGGRPAFIVRFVLAATLGASYGIYGPAFELCEATPREPGSEEYLDSEKYEIRYRNLPLSESIEPLITRVNEIRREHPALLHNRTLRFHPTTSEHVLCYSKSDPATGQAVLVAVNVDPYHAHTAHVELDPAEIGLPPDRPFQMHDLLGGSRFIWQGARHFVELDPHSVPAHIFRIRRHVRSEREFEYFF